MSIAITIPKQKTGNPKKVILLPSLPLNILPFEREPVIKCVLESMDIKEFKQLLDFLKSRGVDVEIHSYIRHKPTNELLEEMLRGYRIVYHVEPYRFNYKDIIYAITLKFRPPVSGMDVKVSPEDLLVVRISII